jgi:hypothetical protein
MKLTVEQISEIDSYIKTFNIDYYELKQEFLDHMICSVEAILEKNQISLNDAIIVAKKDFQPLGFRGIMEERQAELRKQYKKEHWNSIKDFFKFPQIVGSFTLIVSIYLLLNFFSNALVVGTILYLVGFLLVLLENFKLFKLRKKQKQKILRVETFLNEKFLLVMMIPQTFFNGINIFKDTIDSNHFIIKTIVTLILTYCFLSLFVFRKLAKNEITVVNRLYFS